MSLQEDEPNYKYEDNASEMAFRRLPQTAAPLKQTMKMTLDSATSFDLEFADLNKVVWKSGASAPRTGARWWK
jgi:hypothetical protein